MEEWIHALKRLMLETWLVQVVGAERKATEESDNVSIEKRQWRQNSGDTSPLFIFWRVDSPACPRMLRRG